MTIPKGREGAKRTLELMRGLAREGARTIEVRTLAIRQVSGHQQKDYRGEACSLLSFVRDQIRYVRDINGVEVLQTPAVTLKVGGGDCDDKSILLAAMLTSIGHRVQFIAVSFMPDVFSHVWVRTNIGGRWVDLEPTEPISCGERIPSKGAVEHITLDV